jgi:hypothetical protein
MQHPVALRPVRRWTRASRLTVVALGVCLAALGTALVIVLVHTSLASAVAPVQPTTVVPRSVAQDTAVGAPGQPPRAPDVPFAGSAEDGVIPEGSVATLADDTLPAIAKLDPALHEAMRRAEADAGMQFEVTSGWRSAAYQQWLLDDAIRQYGSEDVARQFVATPDRSSHVTGDAVDIAPVDAQIWLIQHGSRYGLCQTYANERWHFELATDPGGVCPQMKADAAA